MLSKRLISIITVYICFALLNEFCLHQTDAIVIRSSFYAKKLSKSVKHLNSAVVETSNVSDTFDLNYYMNIYIGTPPQTFQVFFKLTTNFTWIVDSSYSQIPCVNSDGSVANITKFNAVDSSTFMAQPQIASWNFSDPIESGIWATDTVCIGLDPPLCVQNQLFGQATNSIDNIIVVEYISDGNIGLRPSYPTELNESFLTKILPNLDMPIFSVFLESAGASAIQAAGGLLTFGAIDTTNCAIDNIVYAPIQPETEFFYWAITVNGASIGDQIYSTASLAQVDPYYYYLVGPTDWFTGVTQTLNVSYNASVGAYLLPCNGVYPDIILNITTINNTSIALNIPSSIYLENAGLSDPNLCYLVLGVFAPLSNYGWRFGTTFFRTFCGIFDVGNERIGFAKPLV